MLATYPPHGPALYRIRLTRQPAAIASSIDQESTNGLKVEGSELFYAYMVDNQAIVIPETIDAIRALTRLETNGAALIERTNSALGIWGSLV